MPHQLSAIRNSREFPISEIMRTDLHTNSLFGCRAELLVRQARQSHYIHMNNYMLEYENKLKIMVYSTQYVHICILFYLYLIFMLLNI